MTQGNIQSSFLQVQKNGAVQPNRLSLLQLTNSFQGIRRLELEDTDLSIHSNAHAHILSANLLVRLAKLTLEQQAVISCCCRHQFSFFLRKRKETRNKNKCLNQQ